MLWVFDRGWRAGDREEGEAINRGSRGPGLLKDWIWRWVSIAVTTAQGVAERGGVPPQKLGLFSVVLEPIINPKSCPPDLLAVHLGEECRCEK